MSSPIISLKAETLFHIGSFPVTNSILLGWIVVVFFAIAGLVLRKKVTLIPRGFANLFEFTLEKFLSMAESILGSRLLAERYSPFVFTIFISVMISNWFGLLPGVGSIGLREHGELVPLLRAPSADLNFTLAVAIMAVFAVNLFGAIAIGLKKHLGKFFSIKNPIHTFVGLLEFISEFARMISFSFRLFGNVFAGEVLLLVIGFLAPFFVPIPFLLLELFVGFIQGFVFATLTLVFIAISTAHEEAH